MKNKKDARSVRGRPGARVLALAATASLVASLIPAPALATATQQPAADTKPVVREVGGDQTPAQTGDEAKGTAPQAVAQTNDTGKEEPKANDTKTEAPSDEAGADQGAPEPRSERLENRTVWQ